MKNALKYKKLRHKLEGLFGDELEGVHVFRTKIHYNVVVGIGGKNINCKFSKQYVNALVEKHDIKDVEQEIATVIFQQMTSKEMEPKVLQAQTSGGLYEV